MRSLQTTVLLCALILAAGGCGRQRPTVAFEVRRVAMTEGDCSGGAGCATATIEYPVVTRAPTPAGRDSLNRLLLDFVCRSAEGDTVLRDADAVVKEFLEGYREFAADVSASAQRWSFERHAAFVFDTAGIVSVQLMESSFAGGAHPNSTFRYLAVDALTGRALRLPELLIPGGEDQVRALAEARFRALKDLSPSADLREAGFWFKDDRFALPASFHLRRDGLAFFYNSYEIAPYVMGPTEIVVPYAEARSLLRLQDRR